MFRSALAVVLVTIFADVVVAHRSSSSSTPCLKPGDNTPWKQPHWLKHGADTENPGYKMSADELAYAMVKKHPVGNWQFAIFTKGVSFLRQHMTHDQEIKRMIDQERNESRIQSSPVLFLFVVSPEGTRLDFLRAMYEQELFCVFC